MPALYSDISGHLEFFNLTSNSLKENKTQDNTDAFIVMVEDLADLNRASLASEVAAPVGFNDAPSTSHVGPMRCASLDSCLSRDQFLISMVNEFLNDGDDTVMDESSTGPKSTPLNIVEYMEESNQNEVESLMDFHHIKELQADAMVSPPRNEDNTTSPIEIVMPCDSPPSLFVNMPALQTVIATPSTVSFPNSSTSVTKSSTPISTTSSTATPTAAKTSSTTTKTTTSSKSSTLMVPDRSHEPPTILLNLKNDTIPTNLREISYQRFGRINRNLPAEVHNFRCHLCAFSCKRKELLLQHFRERHPT
ncbi:uncharacterized protein LOC109612612 [Musca domestica]|uniref:Uncharacterized protein LOC109612612 n=1 Tax=Musca domestica TaxID=7370 RepID=A0A9J7IGQ2_MUSDO|nr:uncharacterized protein LOC109612612 [Musca domestica]